MNQKAEDGATLLVWAVFKGHLYIVYELCEAGADVDLPTDRGLTPLMNALCMHEVCNLLAEIDRLFVLLEICKGGAKVGTATSKFPEMQTLLTKQQFRHNILVLVDHIQVNILRGVRKWI